MSRPVQQVAVGLTPELLDEVDAIAGGMRLSRSEIVRQACARYVEAWHDQHRKRAAASKRKRTVAEKPRLVGRWVSAYARGDRGNDD